MMNKQKKLILVICTTIFIVYVFVYKGKTPVVYTDKQETPTEEIEKKQKTACENAARALRSAEYEIKTIKQQLLLSTTASQDSRAVAKAKNRLTTLKSIQQVLDDVISHKKLNCKKHLRIPQTN